MRTDRAGLSLHIYPCEVPTTNAYSILAKYYDQFSADDCDYSSMADFCARVFRDNNAKSGLDLACGTGKMTHRLKKLGFDVFGMDSSVDMLNAARQRGKCLFTLGDMRTFALNHPVDFVTIICDGINYVPKTDIEAVFCNIATALKPNGVLIFDVSSQHKLSSIIADNVFFIDEKDTTLLWSNTLSPDRVDMDIVLFEKSGQTYVRRDEHHTQYIYTVEELTAALTKAGFTVNGICDNYTDKPISATTERITLIVSKGTLNV
jgi:SAM-dependent methyltransferase